MQIRYLCGCNMKAFECFLVIDNLMCSSTTIMRCFDQLQSLTNYVCRSCCAWQGEKRILQKRRVEKETRGEGCEKWCLEIIDFPQTPGHGLQSQDRRSTKKWTKKWKKRRRAANPVGLWVLNLFGRLRGESPPISKERSIGEHDFLPCFFSYMSQVSTPKITVKKKWSSNPWIFRTLILRYTRRMITWVHHSLTHKPYHPAARPLVCPSHFVSSTNPRQKWEAEQSVKFGASDWQLMFVICHGSDNGFSIVFVVFAHPASYCIAFGLKTLPMPIMEVWFRWFSFSKKGDFRFQPLIFRGVAIEGCMFVFPNKGWTLNVGLHVAAFFARICHQAPRPGPMNSMVSWEGGWMEGWFLSHRVFSQW